MKLKHCKEYDHEYYIDSQGRYQGQCYYYDFHGGFKHIGYFKNDLLDGEILEYR